MKKLLLLAVLVIAAGVTACEDPNNPPAEKDTYTVTFNANGGTGGPDPVTVTLGHALPPLDISDKPVHAGQYFTGYYDGQINGTMYYNSGLAAEDLTWDKTEHATLYAHWSVIPLTTISFHVNGGEGTMPAQQIPENTSASLTASTFTRTGYTFAGWAVSSEGPVTTTDGESYTAAAGEHTVDLYAVWTAKMYSISFNANGGSGGPGGTVTVTYGQPMPEITGIPASAEGESFNGYWDAQTGGTQYYTETLASAKNWDKDAAGPITLYAQWESGIALTFNANGGEGGQTAPVRAAYGQPMPALTASAPVNENYSGGYVKYYFDGYWDAQTGGKKYYNADLTSALNWDKAVNTELFARWLTAAQKYNITLGQDDFVAYFVETPPVIDGTGNDPAWEKAKWQPINYEWMYNSPYSHVSSPEDFTGRFKIVWTAERLYILAEITDDIISVTRLSTPYSSPEKDDCLELFIDENASGGTRSSDGGNNFFTYHMSFGGVNVADYIGGANNTSTQDITLRIEGGNILRNSHLNYVIGKNDAAHIYLWETEMKVYNNTYPLRSTPDNTPVTLTDGKKMGFVAAYCDSDGGNRDHFIGSMFVTGSTDDQRNVAYQNSTQYAKLYLVK
jgi:uncharacterized repeat protein (TIGR02543 family)